MKSSGVVLLILHSIKVGEINAHSNFCHFTIVKLVGRDREVVGVRKQKKEQKTLEGGENVTLQSRKKNGRKKLHLKTQQLPDVSIQRNHTAAKSERDKKKPLFLMNSLK